MIAREWTRQARQVEDPTGTHIPFTAPLLSGVCVRPNRDMLDFLLPNPSGGRGTYVLDWKTVAGYAAPTLHDSMLAARLAELPAPEPAAVREAARLIAAEGYAGQNASAAAVRGREAADAARLRFWSRLLCALIDDAGLGGEARQRVLAGIGRAGPGIMTPGLNALAVRLGWESATLFDALGRLSASHAPLCAGGRVPVLVARFERLRADLARELARAQDPVPPAALRRILADLDHCLRHGRTVAEAAMRTIEQPAALLESWRVDPAIVLDAMRGVERSLDGWDRIALLWQDCPSVSARQAVLPELALLLRLAADRIRTEAAAADAAAGSASGAIPGGPAAPPPAEADLGAEVFGGGAPSPALVERNERIRALELDLESAHG